MWKNNYQERMRSVEDVVAMIHSGDCVFVSASLSIPYNVLNVLSDRYQELKDVKIVGCHAQKPIKFFTDPKYQGHFEFHSFFCNGYDRVAKDNGVCNICSINFSNIFDHLLNHFDINVVLVEVSEPDEEGYVYWGPVGVAWNGPVVEQVLAKSGTIIGVVNKHQTRVHGEMNKLHVNEFSCFCRDDHLLPDFVQADVSEEDQKISDLILDRIPDGATLQLGLGGVANAIGFGLKTKRNLSVYSEMFTDSMLELVKTGVITGSIDVGFALGSQEVYKFTESDRINLRPISVTNSIREIQKRDNFISINSCLMADLTGQVCSESIGYKQYSCTGGQLDFVKGASLSNGGKTFLCMHSTRKDKQGNLISRILCALPEGNVVTVPRTDVMYIVTEYGIADMWCQSIPNRVKQMIAIAHPKFRDELRAEAKEKGLL